MHIGTKRFTISFVLVAALLLPSVALAAPNTKPTNVATSDWAVLKTVPTASKLVVKLKSGKTVSGKLSAVTDTTLSLSVKDKAVDLKREDVLSVHQVMGKSAKKATLIGMAVGAGAGAAVGVAGGDDDGFIVSRSQAAGALALLGAGVGALTGYLIGKGGHKRVLIYEAR